MAAPTLPVPESFWQTLNYFNVYRVVSALMLSALGWFFAGQFYSEFDRPLYFWTCVLYVTLSMIYAVTIKLQVPRFQWQLAAQISTDLVCVLTLVYASGGVTTGLGMMLLVNLAAVGLISRGRHTFLFAALATIGLLAVQTLRTLPEPQRISEFFETGLLSIGYFSVAALAYALAQYARASEQLATQRGVDLANLAQINELVIRDMKDGVLVVDNAERIRTRNERSEQLLGPYPPGADMLKLKDYCAELADWLNQWHVNPAHAQHEMRSPVSAAPLRLRAIPIGERPGQGTLIYLEDTSQEQAQARQIKLAALGRLTANVAHEIRNPLSSISHAAELLEEEGGHNDTEIKMLRIIRDNAARLDRMVQEVLELNRRDRAKLERMEPDYLDNFIDDFCQIEKAPRDVFSVEMDGVLVWYFDRNHFHQVLWNLTRNAYRYCQRVRGSVRFYLSQAPLSDYRQLDVIDDGPGVEPEKLNQLFEPFFTTHSQGTGLGLYIARELCEANGATLDYVDVAPGGQFRILMRGTA